MNKAPYTTTLETAALANQPRTDDDGYSYRDEVCFKRDWRERVNELYEKYKGMSFNDIVPGFKHLRFSSLSYEHGHIGHSFPIGQKAWTKSINKWKRSGIDSVLEMCQ